jgi:acyl-CoA reductase-like NAD-dependent aldehyde dehydrogenase
MFTRAARSLLDRAEMETLLKPAPLPAFSPDELQAFARRLHAALRARSALFLETIALETGFVRADCEKFLEGVLIYARDFSGVAPTENRSPVEYEVAGQPRRIQQVRVPWGLISVVLPAKRDIDSGCDCLLSALAAGNRVILRAPTQSARSMALLADAVAEAKAPDNSVA